MSEEMADSLDVRVESTFTVGIDLEAALANPGSDADVVLREGDVLFVPKYNNTVKINGAVMMPNTVAYEPGHSVNDYIDWAGGYSQKAKKSKKFIVYMNGKIARVKGRGKKQIEPGCEIIVPMKMNRQSAGQTVGQVLGYTTSLASLGLMATSIATMSK